MTVIKSYKVWSLLNWEGSIYRFVCRGSAVIGRRRCIVCWQGALWLVGARVTLTWQQQQTNSSSQSAKSGEWHVEAFQLTTVGFVQVRVDIERLETRVAAVVRRQQVRRWVRWRQIGMTRTVWASGSSHWSGNDVRESMIDDTILKG